MNTIVNKLLDVDKEARKILDEAQQYYDKTIADLSAEKKKMYEEYAEKEKRHIEAVRMSEQTAVNEAEAEIAGRYTALTAKLDETYEKSRREWEDTIFNKCVGR